jgi:hypothetical protein
MFHVEHLKKKQQAPGKMVHVERSRKKSRWRAEIREKKGRVPRGTLVTIAEMFHVEHFGAGL